MKQQVVRVLNSSLLVFMAIVCLTFTARVAHAQSYGSIVGTVTDPKGGLEAGASITITDLETNEARTEQANGEGLYRVLNLAPGRYRADVEIAGFKHFTREPIEVNVETTVRIDVSLSVGSVSERVEVTSETPLLDTSSATLQQVVEGKTVQEMPLNGKNAENLIALTPGVVAQGSTSGPAGSNQSSGHTNSTAWNNYQIGGGIAGQSAQFLDGAPTIGLGGNQVFLIPNQDSIAEFRVATAAVSPEFGRFGGGVVNFVTKSGGNDWHGSAYEYFRNKVLNAGDYFSAGQSKPAYNQNQFGGTFGGHILRDKAFFFANYEQYKLIAGSSFTAEVPTAAERSGDFTADAPIYDPFSSVLTGNPNNPVMRTQFSCGGVLNVICPARFDPTANVILNTLQYYPLPNTTGMGYNFARTVDAGTTYKQGGIRLDYNVSEKQHLFGRYTQWAVADIAANNYGNVTGGAPSHQRTQDFVFGDTYTFSPRLLGDVRLSYGRAYYDDLPPSVGTNLSQFGPAFATLSSQVSVSILPAINVSGFGPFMGVTSLDTNYRNTFALTPEITYLLGRHSLKAGADLRFMDYNELSLNNPTGQYYFGTAFTSANGTSASPTGNSIASMLVGAVSNASLNTGREVGQYNWYQGYYVADSWQATRNLVVNGGIRYELPGTWYERQNRASVLLPNVASPLGNVGNYNLTGGLFLVDSDNWKSNGTEKVRYGLFSPRLGVAYNPVPDTVVRAGYSLTYIPFDSYDGASPDNSPVNTAVTNMVTSVNGQGYIPANTLADPFPAGGVAGTTEQTVLQPVGRSQAYLDSLVGLNITGPDPRVRFGYNQQWTASLQQQFTGNMMLQLAYAGNRGTFLPQGQNYQTGAPNNINQLPDQYDSMGAALSTNVPNPFAGLLNSTGSLNGAMIPAGQLLLPHPQFGSITQSNATGDSIYHAMLVTFQKRFTGGGLLNANYTWSKNIGNVGGTPFTFIEAGHVNIGSPQDYNNPRGDRSVLNSDLPQNFVASYVLPLPFGKNQAFFSKSEGIAGGFANGWAVNGIVTFQSGYHLSLSTPSNALSSFGAGTIRPNYVQGCKKQTNSAARSRLGEWFNTACFVAPDNYSFGNEPRVDAGVNEQGVANYDFSASKDTGLKDNLKLQMKAEFFNLFNRTQFGAPGTVVGQFGYGQITLTNNQPRQIQLSGRLIF